MATQGKATEGAFQWLPLALPEGSPIQVYGDGHFSVCGMEFNQYSTFGSMRLGGVILKKPDGAGSIIEFITDQVTLYVKYEAGEWLYRGTRHNREKNRVNDDRLRHFQDLESAQ